MLLRCSGVILLTLIMAGCAGFQSKPIFEHDVLRELRAIRLEATPPGVKAPPPPPPLKSRAFDATNGLSSDEAVAAALVLNRDLRTFRKERDVAEGELIAAGLLPNPELQLTWLKIERITTSFATGGLDLSLNWAPPRPGERGLKKARAQARIDEVRAEIAGAEWRLATEVRKAYAVLLAVEARLRLTEALLRLQQRILDFEQDKRALGDASRLDVNLAKISTAEARFEREILLNERNQARQALNRLLGLPPLYEITVEATGDSLGYRPYPLLLDRLENVMVERRPDLRAAKQAYEQAEHSLHLAYLQRIPWFRFGPAYARDELDNVVKNRWGIGLGIDLPIANLNQGEIARLEATRDQRREGFTALVLQDRAELNEAYRNLRAQEGLIRLYQETTEPALNENLELTEAGFEMKEFNLLQLLTTQDRVFKSRRQFIEAQLAYWEAVFDLERALGARLSEISTLSSKVNP
jgi:cobalt-zinc-cadmium efflux system outer membrane protein